MNNMADMQIFETVATQASHVLGTYNALYRPWNNMHFVPWCVSEVKGEGKVVVQLSVVGFMLVYECHWINVQHSWLTVRRWQVLGLCDWGHTAKYCLLCVGIPHCEHSAVPLLLRSTANLALSVYKTGRIIFFFYCDKSMGQQQGGGGLRHTQMVYGVRHWLLKNKHVNIFGIMILMLVHNKYGVCFYWDALNKVQFFAVLSIQTCEPRQNWSCYEWLF
jgi:hypothetical protein